MRGVTKGPGQEASEAMGWGGGLERARRTGQEGAELGACERGAGGDRLTRNKLNLCAWQTEAGLWVSRREDTEGCPGCWRPSR